MQVQVYTSGEAKRPRPPPPPPSQHGTPTVRERSPPPPPVTPHNSYVERLTLPTKGTKEQDENSRHLITLGRLPTSPLIDQIREEVVRPGMTKVFEELRKELRLCQNKMRYVILLKEAESRIRSIHGKTAALIKKKVGDRDCRRDILLNYRIR